MQSPLLEAARESVAIYAPDGTMPLSFGDAGAEYRHALDSAVLFDCSDHGKLEATGAEAATFLHNLCTNDIVNLPLGGGCEAYFCDPRAKTQAHALIYHVLIDVARHAFLLDVTPGYGQKLFKHLDRHLIAEQVELSDRSDEFAQMHLAGPEAKRILEQALGDSLPELREFLHMERTFGTNATCHIRRHDPLGVPGFDIVCANARSAGVWKLLAAAGARPAGSQAFETLRIEAGTPVYGVDIDENRFVMELPRALRAVSYAKGCYLGQEPIIMARDRAGHVNRAFLGMKVLEEDSLPKGSKLFHDGQEVGIVTSSSLSPRLGSPLALGYIRRGHQEPGTRLEAETPGGRRPVEVLAFPPVSSAV
jgi:folate-binding protein YgfZ